MDEMQALLQALSGQQSRHNQASLALDPQGTLVHGLNKATTTERRGRLPQMFERMVDSHNLKKLQPELQGALLEALQSQQGMGEIQAKIQAMQEREEEQRRARLATESGYYTPEQAAYIAAGGKAPAGGQAPKPSYQDIVNPDGSKTKYAVFPDGRKVEIGPAELAPKQEKPDTFTDEAKLRAEYDKATKGFQDVTDSFGRIQASAEDPSPAGDLALIFNYMKVLDPGSTVREGEFATAQQSAGVPDRVVAQYNSVVNGQRLSESQRADFYNRAGKLYQKAADLYGQRKNQYAQLATNYGFDPEKIFVDKQVLDVSQMEVPPPPEGFVLD